jgi:hypothetical protein
MYGQQTTQLDPLTQALITLQQGANLKTPKGDTLSVAGQAVQAMQPQQPQMPPQGGQSTQPPQPPQPPQPGIAGLAQNVATGNAIQQQQQQQAQQAMMQMAQQQQRQQQQQPQTMAEGGLAGLPASNMGFAEGGVIPYFDGGGVRTLGGGELPERFNTPELEDEQQYFTLSPYDLPEIRAYKILKNRELQAKAYADPSRNRDTFKESLLTAAPQQAPVTASQRPPQQAPRPAMPRAAPTAPRAAPSARAGQFTMPSTEYGKGFDPASAGILGALPPGVRPPELPPEVETPEQREMAEGQKRLLALQQNRPDFTAQLMSALDADKQTREKIAAAQAANAPDVVSRLGQLARNYSASGMRGVSEGLEANKKAATARMEATRQADKLDALARVELQKAEYAMKIGDIDKAIAYTEKAAGMRDKQNQFRQTEFGNMVNIFGTQVTDQGNIRTNASADARSQADREARGMESKADRESRERISAGSNATTLKAATIREELDQKKASLALYRQQVAGLIKQRDAKMPFDSAGAEKINKQIKNLSEQSGFTPLELLGVEDAGAGAGAGGTPADVAAYLKQYGKGS